MEQEELINEKNELFEGFKSEFSKQAKRSKIGIVFICLFVGLFIASAVSGHINWLPCTIICILLFGAGCHSMIWHNKIAKADDAQEFLTIYDKNRKIEKWKTIICLLLFIAIITMDFIGNKDIDRVIWYGALLVIILITRPWQDPYKIDIDRLRKLVQQS